MKDISMYFEPIDQMGEYGEHQLGTTTSIHRENSFPNFEKGSGVVVFDVDLPSENIRSSFYELFNHFSVSIYDLGHLKPGANQEEKVFALKDAVVNIIKNGKIPVVLTADEAVLNHVFKAYKDLEQTVNVTDIAPQIKFSEQNPEALLTQIFTDNSGLLFNYTNIGYQTYYNSRPVLDFIETLYFDAIRLGVIKSDRTLAEPYLRNTDLLNIDFNAVEKSSFTSNEIHAPNGFSGEDICALSRYAGISDKLNQMVLKCPQQIEEQDAVLIAQTLWYFIEGVDQRKGDFPVASKKKYKKFVVGVKEFKDEVNFYKSDKSGRWWMEVPYPGNGLKKFQRHYLVPCSRGDYELSLKDDLPDLWWKTYQKLT